MLRCALSNPNKLLLPQITLNLRSSLFFFHRFPQKSPFLSLLSIWGFPNFPMVQVQVQIMPEHNSDPAAPPPPPPPPHNRRPRVREVSSRFMSPSVPRRPRTTEPDPDENSETPFPLGCSISQRKQTQTPQLSLDLNQTALNMPLSSLM